MIASRATSLLFTSKLWLYTLLDSNLFSSSSYRFDYSLKRGDIRQKNNCREKMEEFSDHTHTQDFWKRGDGSLLYSLIGKGTNVFLLVFTFF